MNTYYVQTNEALNKNQTDFSILQPDFTSRRINNVFEALTQEISSLILRLLKQSFRRPSLLLTGILQPLLWLTIFSALFQNAPIQLFTYGQKYSDFISSGIIVFTGFSAALNSGLPIMFDREFGFLNRILSSSIYSRYSIAISSSVHMIISSFIQTIFIIYMVKLLGNSILDLKNIFTTLLVLLLLINSISGISLILAFILPGHIELLACILLINLPLLFSSTALAPLIFMPSWLQVIASLNPLTYAIETIRYTYLQSVIQLDSTIMNTVWGNINFKQIIIVLISSNIISTLISYKLIANKFAD
uniref:ABC transmembrane type-2 domain-containing protein n=1 Tax=Trichogloeopsis pedicellata TaxID=1495610 RepID=A0A1G4P0V9_9FLOR|nr:Hypothetical protein ycf38 [Trichogloeopsis pedicellata]SCW24476.1 Hypothetical protein ycf38 [Trichogloeopsis pedicellata]